MTASLHLWSKINAAQIKLLITGGDIVETSAFDVKEDWGMRPEDLAKDIAAMANDGGVIVVGIRESRDSQPASETPVSLTGAKERVLQIARASIMEPPLVFVHEVPTPEDASRGFVVIVVPRSLHAPHMVTKKGVNRYYGRYGPMNIELGHGDVERLFQRRKVSRDDAAADLVDVIPWLEQLLHEQRMVLYLRSRPLTDDRLLLEALSSPPTNENLQHALTSLIAKSCRTDLFQGDATPFINFRHHRITPAGFVAGTHDEYVAAENCSELRVSWQGEISLVANTIAHDGIVSKQIFPRLTSGYMVRFLDLACNLYEQASFIGEVDLKIVVAGLNGAIGMREGGMEYQASGFVKNDTYEAALRVSTIGLKDSRDDIATDLLRPLLRPFFGANWKGKCLASQPH